VLIPRGTPTRSGHPTASASSLRQHEPDTQSCSGGGRIVPAATSGSSGVNDGRQLLFTEVPPSIHLRDRANRHRAPVRREAACEQPVLQLLRDGLSRHRGAGGSGFVATGERGNVYAGKDGNVYRKQDGTWQQYDNGGCSNTDRRLAGAQRSRATAPRTASGQARWTPARATS